ncbi:MAG: CaiB/BaiF CoA transferase family protein [Pseudomonadota bacterium]
MRDLEGVLVVSVEQAVAAPYATSLLADAGARVIKVERPEGDFARGYDRFVHGESTYFVWINRGKESICLDLRQDGERDILTNMIARADVFVQNLAPGAAARLGVGPGETCRRHPSLIYCSISGYGEDGPYRDQKAYDMLVQGEAGLLSVNGTPEGAARVGISVCDIAAGQSAQGAILQALFARQRTGRGRAIDVSMFHTMADWMNVPFLQTLYSGTAPRRVGLRHPSIAPYGAFDCADGREVLLAVQSDREWRALCDKVLGRPDLGEDVRFARNVDRVANSGEIDAMIAAVLSRMDRETAIRTLTGAGIASGRLSTMEDLLVHPQARRLRADSPSGPVEMMARGTRVAGRPEPGGGRVPALDEHGAALRAEFARATPGATGTPA